MVLLSSLVLILSSLSKTSLAWTSPSYKLRSPAIDGTVHSTAFSSSSSSSSFPFATNRRQSGLLRVAAAIPDTSVSEGSSAASTTTALTVDIISKLRFRELQTELAHRNLDTTGTTSQLRTRLRQAEGLTPEECVVNEDDMADECVDEPKLNSISVSFVDQSDPDYERKELLLALDEKVRVGHWKAAVRKLKQYTRRFPSIPESTLNSVLTVCMDNRLQGARASEPVRKILELMVELQYPISEKVGNYCVKNCLGFESPHSTHQGFGGIDTALAMMAALDQALTPVQLETYDKVCCALAKEGSIESAVKLLRTIVNDKSETPSLGTFASVAYAAVNTKVDGSNATFAEQVPAILGLAKAAGYDLDNIASIEDGRNLLAAGVIASEQMQNIGLGLRLLTAASKASVVDPDDQGRGGDVLVSSSSSMAQRAATLIHKRAINRAVEDQQWKLAVKLLELMLERKLRPSSWIWRNVVTCCAKAEKSKKASSLLLEWVAAAERGNADKPPLSVFNTVMNVCEICNEQDLTLEVLDSMKKTHDTEGNIITFNIALKRLAKQGNSAACEGIILSMLTEGVEPTVVSYTTAIASCVNKEGEKRPALAYEWLKRMRSRLVNPNVLTYNTVLASCEDGSLESAVLASKVASEMLADVEKQLVNTANPQQEPSSTMTTNGAFKSKNIDMTNVIPNSITKSLAKRLVKQVDDAVARGEMDARVAEETVKKSLNALAEYVNCTTTECFLEQIESGRQLEKGADAVGAGSDDDEDEIDVTSRDEFELEYTAVSDVHRIAEV
ncbi:hypothetical protein ACA910_008952 [Epithemia clementina (nom. ined.)]